MPRLVLIVLATFALLAAFIAANDDQRVQNRVEEMMSSMDLDAMLGQMAQLDVSTILHRNRTLNRAIVHEHARLNIGSYLNTPGAELNDSNPNSTHNFSPREWRELITEIQDIYAAHGSHPILYGLDSVHGANYVGGATLFGQQLNAAATFNPNLVYDMGRITARDTAASGIPWLFAPILEISQNPLWARTFETFGEDPHLVSVMADAIVRGIQSNGTTAACMKHIIGYSKTPTGHDRAGVTISDFDLLNHFAPSFMAAIKAGAMTAMESYISINGVPVVANTKILRDLVRHDMGFQGLIVTDYAEIHNLHVWHRVAKSDQDAVRMALTNSPLDMSMVPFNTTFIDMARLTIQENPELLDRVKDSVRRILTTKVKLGLYENALPGTASDVALVGQNESRQAALELARESVVLLKNEDNLLPLSPDSDVFLTGHSADNVGLLCGGWSLRWQGVSGNSLFPHGISLRQGIANVLDARSGSVHYANDLHPNGSYSSAALQIIKSRAAQSMYTIVAIGEGEYAEKPGDLDDLNLPLGQVDYVREIAATGTKVILVLVQGRPRLLQGLADIAHAVVYAMLPGELGGQALADILFGRVNPSGRLPITYPKTPANIAIPYNHLVSTRCRDDGPCKMEWNFGHGLSYSVFEYGNVSLSKTSLCDSDDASLEVIVAVTNTGSKAGKETVTLFLIQPFRAISVPEVKQLKKFTKIHLEPGETQVVSFTLTREDWGVFDPQIGSRFHRIVEPGKYFVAVKPETDCNVYDESGAKSSGLCAQFTIQDN
ncbi:Lysosomal beta glucosidase [Phytophthora fragariae]|uniref:beta-glucosidase n=2 Tax=Phytophthora fragariae TaxID=53985 RepID=A0A6A3EX88_9STRA|nr:Lysosomal beta glucosidase [Phytophthora fragariae]KAE8936080.1 Lysosomal beta glucosidase [Phytophthora fragariae]KAE9106917.1 Lysosomal beta glucosidase [Phytophthora fragariae]KAE9142819.1 Lysosomal beta glucosidase [Phytophthora fragariae]KAE9206791.1 Lysosomal beta glucosidase [Phytophthora fragariae]